jgi:hypothetical protein
MDTVEPATLQFVSLHDCRNFLIGGPKNRFQPRLSFFGAKTRLRTDDEVLAEQTGGFHRCAVKRTYCLRSKPSTLLLT